MKNSRKSTVLSLLVSVCAIALFAVALPACETVKGVGKDVENAGEGIHDASEGAQKKM